MIKAWCTIVCIVLINSAVLYGQERKEIETVFKTYQTELQLTDEQSDLLNETLSKFDFKTSVERKSLVSHNRKVKTRDLEIQSILNKDQFKKYLILKNDLEPEATYKFK